MVERNNRGRNRRTNRKVQTGTAFLTVGTLLMLGNLGVAAVGLPHFLSSLGIDAVGTPAAASLAILRFLRTIAFHPAALLPFAYGILVLFFALAGILAGLLLLRNRSVENA